jgi:hypothetical protein
LLLFLSRRSSTTFGVFRTNIQNAQYPDRGIRWATRSRPNGAATCDANTFDPIVSMPDGIAGRRTIPCSRSAHLPMPSPLAVGRFKLGIRASLGYRPPAPEVFVRYAGLAQHCSPCGARADAQLIFHTNYPAGLIREGKTCKEGSSRPGRYIQVCPGCESATRLCVTLCMQRHIVPLELEMANTCP